jgi:hypothetical protein
LAPAAPGLPSSPDSALYTVGSWFTMPNRRALARPGARLVSEGTAEKRASRATHRSALSNLAAK